MSAGPVLRTLVLTCCVAALAACAAPEAIGPGVARDQVQNRWGEPRASYAVGEGQRWFYERTPGEQERLDFDANGRLLARTQVFTAAHFLALSAGQWSATQVLQGFGPPLRRQAAVQEAGEDGSGSVWIYSWREFGKWRIARVRLGAEGVVQGVELADDTKADDRYR